MRNAVRHRAHGSCKGLRRNVDNKWGKVTITNIPDYERYRNSWGLIADHLGVPTKAKTLAGMDAASG